MMMGIYLLGGSEARVTGNDLLRSTKRYVLAAGNVCNVASFIHLLQFIATSFHDFGITPT